MWVIFIWIGLAVAVGAMAGNRGRNGFGWFLLALMISPLLASVFLLVSPDLHLQKAVIDEIRNSKKCPFCAELIKLEASVCRYCGRDVADAPVTIDAAPFPSPRAKAQTDPFQATGRLVEYSPPAKMSSEPSYGILSGDDAYGLNIVGESHYQNALEQIVGGRTEEGAEFYCAALLLPEPQNPYDRNAIRVIISRKTVGYLSRTDAVQFGQTLSKGGYVGAACAAVVVGGWDRGDDQGFFGVRLNVTLPFSLTDPPTPLNESVNTRGEKPVLSTDSARTKSSPLARPQRAFAKAVLFLVAIAVVGVAAYFQFKPAEAPTPKDELADRPTVLPTPLSPAVPTSPKTENAPVPRAKPSTRKALDPPLNLAPPK